VTAQVVCAGLATLDTIYRVPQLPPKDGRVVATERVVAGGGPAATAAVTLARLGVDVAFVGAVGSDEAGLEIVDGLEEEGVDVSAVAIVGARGRRRARSSSRPTARARSSTTRAAPRPASGPASRTGCTSITLATRRGAGARSCRSTRATRSTASISAA
jgi:sugar/nucleoside kinase (ribokinase family)